MEWTRGPAIGRGSSAAVSLATTATGHLFAVKSTDVSSSTLLQNEQYLISQLCSPFIIKCFGSDITRENNKSFYNILLEYAPGGTLSDLIRNQGGSLDENAIRFYTHQLLKGLNYLHENGFVHCDIKGQNILIGEDGLKIADFGCAKWGDSAAPAFAGTPAYMAPEVSRGEEQSFPADIWALGCTIIEMATGSNPWPEMKDPASALYRVAYSDAVPETPSWFSDAAKDFVGRCLMKDPRVRWTAAELLQHEFLDSTEMNCAQVRESTPTSVMEQHFWDALEASDSSPDPTENASYSDSPAGRIMGLIGDFDALLFTEWTEEEDWVTVRGNESECLNDEQELINEECVTVYGVDEEEIEASNFIEDSLLNSLSDEISSVNIGSFEFMFGDTEIDDSISEIVIVRKIIIKNSFNSDQLFLKSFSCSVFLSLLAFFSVVPLI